MCGICGIITPFDRQPDRSRIEAMTDRLAHRGPDDQGVKLINPCGLGHRRLSIIDIEHGQQPMSYDDERWWISFNGEIYNYRELRHELETDGCRFRTNSDTEVLLAGWSKWGAGLLQRLNGIFAFCIWDKGEKRAWLARDHVGVKPLYWSFDKGTLTFASELRALLAGLEKRPELNPDALAALLAFRHVPSPLCLVKGIHKLEPGHCLSWSPDEDEPEPVRYWTFAPNEEVFHDECDLLEQYGELLNRAVKRQLVADVPVGIFLSGGVDSGLLAKLMASCYSGQIEAYTVGFQRMYADDEIASASNHAEKLGIRHHSIRISDEQFYEDFLKTVTALEEPVGSSSVVPYLHLCQAASKTHKVMLSGQGVDELWAGYPRHLGARYGRTPAAKLLASDPVRKLLGLIPRNRRLKRAAQSLGEPVRTRRFLKIYENTSETLRRQLLPRLQETQAFESSQALLYNLVDMYLGEMKLRDDLSAMIHVDLRRSLCDDLLFYSDKLSMSFGLEVRVPYLDIEIVEFLETVPGKYKIQGLKQKALHKKFAESQLHRKMVYKKKISFDTPLDSYLRTGMGRNIEEETLASAIMDTFVDRSTVKRLFVEHRDGKEDWSVVLLLIWSLAVWEKQFITDN